jgi:hypothetical protein
MKITVLIPWLVKTTGSGWGEYFFVEDHTTVMCAGNAS